MEQNINVAIVDDETLFRQGVAFILSRHEHITISFQANDGQELIDILDEQEEQPDIILLDLKMPKLNGVETSKILRKQYPEIKIIALTSYFSKPFIVNMINIGAVAYLAKNATPAQMLHTINEVHNKGFYYDDEVMKIIHQGVLGNNNSKKSTFDSSYLTKREKEILLLICDQYTTNEIADMLFISPRTVEGHRNNLLLKTESKNTAGLVLYAIENKIFNIVKDAI
ncbi:MAG: response regulator transcription factor [Flavobacteriaceae bacterium]|nr:response regulator transcription factor [Flavobacteriaceae bacterium]